MTFAGPAATTLLPALGALAAGLIALYLLKLRRRRVEVPYAGLWQRILRQSEARAWWRKLRRLLSLLFLLLILGVIGFAIADPRLAASKQQRSLAILIDASASMQARDGGGGLGERGGETRLDAAKRAAHDLVKTLGGDDQALVMSVDARPAAQTGLTSDERELARAIDAIEATDTRADVDAALRLAGDALRGQAHATIVLIGDGAYDDAVWSRVAFGRPADAEPEAVPRRAAGGVEPSQGSIATIDLGAADLRFVAIGTGVGRSSDNLAVTAFAVRRYRANQTAYEVLVEARSFAEKPMSAQLELLQDGEVVNVERLELAAGERVVRTYGNLAGEGSRLEAHLSALSAGDALPVDDRAYAVLTPKKKLRVLCVTPGNLFLEGALLLDENLALDKLPPAAYQPTSAAGYDAVVFDGFVPESAPPTHAVYLNPRGERSPFAIRGELKAPIVTEVAERHPLARWLVLKDLNIVSASRFVLAPGDVAVASTLKQPIIAAGERAGHKVVAIGFDVRKSDLPLRVAFPVLLVNALEWFSGQDSSLLSSLPTGEPWRITLPPALAQPSGLVLVAPDGARQPALVVDGKLSALGMRAGFYTLVEEAPAGRHDAERGLRATDRALMTLAANLAEPEESRVAARRELRVAGHALLAPERGRVGLKRTFWPYLLLAALALLTLEWWTYNRRVTV